MEYLRIANCYNSRNSTFAVIRFQAAFCANKNPADVYIRAKPLINHIISCSEGKQEEIIILWGQKA